MMKRLLSTLALGALLGAGTVYAKEEPVNPFEEMQKIQQEMDKMFQSLQQRMMQDDAFKKFDMSLSSSKPAMDIEDLGKQYRVRLNIPGVDYKNIKITVKDRELIVKAKTEQEKKEEKGNFVKQERFVGSYERVIPLPKDADEDKLKSTYKDGVLEILIDKK